MDSIHIQSVFDELADRFGFPEMKWKAFWKVYLDSQPRGENEISLFLKWGNENINPILNGLLLRRTGESTFSNLCEYIIKKSSSYRNKQQQKADRLKFYTKIN